MEQPVVECKRRKQGGFARVDSFGAKESIQLPGFPLLLGQVQISLFGSPVTELCLLALFEKSST